MDTVITNLIPIFIIALVGFIAGKLHILPKNTSSALCSFLFYFCSPAVSFSNIINSDIRDIFNLRFVLAVISFEAIAFLLLYFIYHKAFGLDRQSLIVHIGCSFYGNISYVGIPVSLALFNNAIPNVIVIMIHGVLTFPFLVFLMDTFSGADTHAGVVSALKNAAKNPNIFVPVIGVILVLFKIQLPKVLTDSIELLGKPTTTVGMFALGMTCSDQHGIHSAGHVFLKALGSAMVKLIVCPAIAFMVGKFIFHLDPQWLNSLVIIAMLPAALLVYILSQRYNSEEDFASISVLTSTLLFSVTISLYILILGL